MVLLPLEGMGMDAIAKSAPTADAAPANPPERPKLVALSDHARTNAQVDVLALLRELLTDLEEKAAAGEPLPNNTFIIMARDSHEGYHISYWRSKLTPEKECYLLNQALLKCLIDQRD